MKNDLDERGWRKDSWYAFAGRPTPPRNGVRWNDKEDYDLVDAYTAGVENLAEIHGRTEGAICQRLEYRGHMLEALSSTCSRLAPRSRAWEGACRYMEFVK